MDTLDRTIKGYLEEKRGRLLSKDRGDEGPSTEELYLFITDELRGERLHKVLLYLKNNPDGQNLISEARRLLEKTDESAAEEVPRETILKAKGLVKEKNELKCPHCGKTITPFKNPLKDQLIKNTLWLFLAAGSLCLSFFVRRYFLQCIAASVFFGIKWVLDQRATKMQILIYKALKDDDSQNERPDFSGSRRAENFQD